MKTKIRKLTGTNQLLLKKNDLQQVYKDKYPRLISFGSEKVNRKKNPNPI
jgi:hypothetical protein